MKTKIALLLIDIQNDYFEGGSNRLCGSEEAAIEASRLVKYFRIRNLPVVHVQHISTRAGAKFFLPDTIGAEIYHSVSPKDDEPVVIKYTPNSFFKTDLKSILDSMNITDLTVCGMMTHLCIDTTVRAAKDLGYNSTVVYDACATKDLKFQEESLEAKDVQLAFLAALYPYFAQICSVDDIVCGTQEN